MSFKVARLCKASSAMNVYIGFGKFCDIFDKERVSFVNSDCEYVFKNT